jgi:hypothetical protein
MIFSHTTLMDAVKVAAPSKKEEFVNNDVDYDEEAKKVFKHQEE